MYVLKAGYQTTTTAPFILSADALSMCALKKSIVVLAAMHCSSYVRTYRNEQGQQQQPQQQHTSVVVTPHGSAERYRAAVAPFSTVAVQLSAWLDNSVYSSADGSQAPVRYALKKLSCGIFLSCVSCFFCGWHWFCTVVNICIDMLVMSQQSSQIQTRF